MYKTKIAKEVRPACECDEEVFVIFPLAVILLDTHAGAAAFLFGGDNQLVLFCAFHPRFTRNVEVRSQPGHGATPEEAAHGRFKVSS